MNRGASIFLISLFIFLLISHPISAGRILQDHQGSASSMTNMEEDDIATLMGFEECNENDQDCTNRRMIADAHLDYIYTQRHNKPKDSP